MILKQPGSRMCFVCGRENQFGLHAEFLIEDDKVVVEFTPEERHQGYPGVVTAKMELRYRHPVPIGQPIRVVGWTTRNRGRTLEAQGEVRLADGTVAVEAKGIFVEIPEGRRQEMESLVF
jgi:acyl-CoA thioesterase FadM